MLPLRRRNAQGGGGGATPSPPSVSRRRSVPAPPSPSSRSVERPRRRKRCRSATTFAFERSSTDTLPPSLSRRWRRSASLPPLSSSRRRRHRSTASIEEEEGQSIATAVEEEKFEEEDDNDEDEGDEERSCATAITIEEEECLTADATVETLPLRMEIHRHRDRWCLARPPPTSAVLKPTVLDWQYHTSTSINTTISGGYHHWLLQGSTTIGSTTTGSTIAPEVHHTSGIIAYQITSKPAIKSQYFRPSLHSGAVNITHRLQLTMIF
jgi:hypothetical protein